MNRGMDPYMERVYKECREKEFRLRLKWFRRNQDRLMEIAEKMPETNELSENVKNEAKRLRIERYRNAVKRPRLIIDDPPPTDLDPRCEMHIMKPVDPKLINLFYEQNTQHRKLYLKLRSKVLPEDRYYFKETSSFTYGWDLQEYAKIHGGPKFGRARIIENSFYRRFGIHRDPDYYREPSIN